jgi:hypothetical protein
MRFRAGIADIGGSGERLVQFAGGSGAGDDFILTASTRQTS